MNHVLYIHIFNDQQFTLNKTNEIKDYFIAEIKKRELMSKGLRKYLASFLKMLKLAGNKKNKHNKIVMLARSKLNSIEKKIFEALINNEIGHEGFMIAINEERNYRELKESIRMMKS